MPLNPFLIGTQREGEDQVTYAFASTLEAAGGAALGTLLNSIGGEDVSADGDVLATVQESAITSRPDARLEISGKLVVLVESKVVKESLGRRQVEDHLDGFGTVRGEVAKVLLALTPDREPPAWWDDLADQHPQVVFLHGAWSDVHRWAVAEAASADEGGAAKHILGSLADLLVGKQLAARVSIEFDGNTIARIEHGASAWYEDLKQQHAAQEAFLGQVEQNFLSRLSPEIVNQATSKGGSRWGARSWSPVDSYVEVRLGHRPLDQWARQKLWVEVFFAPWAKPPRLQLRSGLLLEGRKTVLTWHGAAKDEAARVFADRMWHFRHGSSYAEVWAWRPFTADAVDEMHEYLVTDLLVWVNDVLPALEKRQ